MTHGIETPRELPEDGSAESLSIGGLSVLLQCTDRSLADRIRQRYRGFFAIDVPQFNVQVTVKATASETAGRSALWQVPEALFSAGKLCFDSPGFLGRIDSRRAGAQLALASAHPVEDLDYFLRAVFALLAFDAGGLLFHAAGILKEGRVFLFFGPSGSGKSTIARLSTQASVLNDDLVLLMPSSGGWDVHATPFWNPTQVRPAAAQTGRLAGIFKLVQDQQACAAPLTGARAVADVLACAPIVPADPERVAGLLQRCAALVAASQSFTLHFRKDSDFWDVVERAVS